MWICLDGAKLVQNTCQRVPASRESARISEWERVFVDVGPIESGNQQLFSFLRYLHMAAVHLLEELRELLICVSAGVSHVLRAGLRTLQRVIDH